MRLEGMQPAKQARFDSAMASVIGRRGCAPNTRRVVLDNIRKWKNDKAASKVFWMNGMAGTGKTTIAYSFCAELKAVHQLGASFFCSQELPDCRHATRIVPTIAYQLARFSCPFQRALCRVLGSDPDLGMSSVAMQFDKLLVQPLLQVEKTLPLDNLVVVLDALDECNDRVIAQTFLNVLLQNAAKLPLMFFITCRPEIGLYDRLQSWDNSLRSVLHLHDIEPQIVQGDIQTYLATELQQVLPDQIHQLAQLSGRSFIFAATTARYIDPLDLAVDFSYRLSVVLSATWIEDNKAYTPIDALYKAVLRTSLDDDRLESTEADIIRKVMRTVVCAREPMSLATLAGLLSLTVAKVELAIRPLRSLLDISKKDGLVSTLHASFPHYMLNPKRSGEFFCDPKAHNEVLVQCCFDTMRRLLRFNICDLESSYILDADVPELSDRIISNINPELLYACKYWIDHLCVLDSDKVIMISLRQFLDLRVLFWLEVLNLTRYMHGALAGLPKLCTWLQLCGTSSHMYDMAQDIHNFAITIAGSIVSSGTPHIYISVLASWNRQKPMWVRYGKLTQGLIQNEINTVDGGTSTAVAKFIPKGPSGPVVVSLDGSRMVYQCGAKQIGVFDVNTGQMALGLLESPSRVVTIAYSPDGHMIAAFNSNATISIWDAHTGDLRVDSFQSNFRGWCAPLLIFSPDGEYIAAASVDETVHMWSTHTGAKRAISFSIPRISALFFTPELPSLLSASDAIVTCIVFSLNNERLVAGASDGSIYIWNAQTGDLSISLFAAHTEKVTILACSTDATCVASGAGDGVRIWDAQTGGLIANPIHDRHTRSATSLAFSPDCKYIASGSEDGNVCIRNVRTGHVHAGPLIGSTGIIRTVIFNLDGSALISVSEAGLVCIWDTKSTHTAKLVPATKHTDTIHSIAISLDNNHFAVSTRSDPTIRVWDKKAGNNPIASLAGHFEDVSSIAFSNDGWFLASGSEYGRICFWDLKTEKLVAGPFAWHTSNVDTVAFSPDGRRIASEASDCSICIWDIKTEAMLYIPPEGLLTSPSNAFLAFSHSGYYIVTSSMTVSACVRNSYTGEQICSLSGTNFESAAFSSDDKLIVSISSDGAICRWDTITGKMVSGPLDGETNFSNLVSLSHDGSYLAFRSGRDGTSVLIKGTKDGRVLAGPFRAHTSRISSVVISADGTCVISGDLDGRVFVWSVHIDEQNFHSVTRAWSIEDDGWILGPKRERLLWVAPDSFKLWLNAAHPVLMDGRRPLGFNIEAASVGPRWRELEWYENE